MRWFVSIGTNVLARGGRPMSLLKRTVGEGFVDVRFVNMACTYLTFGSVEFALPVPGLPC
jgi:hypothetical protein